VNVASALRRGIDNILVSRLTAASERDLTELEDTLASIELSAADDERLLCFAAAPKASSRPVFSTSYAGSEASPPRRQIFSGAAARHRLAAYAV
jgi:hypothetical protein